MKHVFKTLQVALYVTALPLIATAVVSGQALLENSNSSQVIAALDDLVSATAEPLNNIQAQVNHVLKIDEAGGISGQVITQGSDDLVYGSSNTEVALYFNGQSITSTMTSNDGTFRFNGISPGPYTFMSRTDESIALFGVYVVQAETVPAEKVQMSVWGTSNNTQGVRDIVFQDMQKVNYMMVPTMEQYIVMNQPSMGHLNSDGIFSGRLLPLMWNQSNSGFDMTGNNVYLLNASGVVASSSVDADGFYQFQNVQPGIYDFAARGPHGAAAITLQVFGADETAANSSDVDFSLASTRRETQEPEVFETILTEPTLPTPIQNQNRNQVEVVNTPQQQPQTIVEEAPAGFVPSGGGFAPDLGFSQGGFGGGGSGGLGGGLGGLPIGQLVGAGLSAFVVSEVFDEIGDDDDNVAGAAGATAPAAAAPVPPTVVPPTIIPPTVIPPTPIPPTVIPPAASPFQ